MAGSGTGDVMLQEELLDRQAAAEAGIPLRLANAEVVTAEARFRGAVTVEDGVIVAVEEGGSVPAGALDCRGELLLPGLVDLHTDHCEDRKSTRLNSRH